MAGTASVFVRLFCQPARAMRCNGHSHLFPLYDFRLRAASLYADLAIRLRSGPGQPLIMATRVNIGSPAAPPWYADTRVKPGHRFRPAPASFSCQNKDVDGAPSRTRTMPSQTAPSRTRTMQARVILAVGPQSGSRDLQRMSVRIAKIQAGATARPVDPAFHRDILA